MFFLKGVVCTLLIYTASLCADPLYERFITPFESNTSLQSFSIGIDNDFFTIKNKDRYYSHGTKLEYSIFDLASSKSLNQSGISLSQKIFTPQNLKKDADLLGSNERPYAGLLLLELKSTQTDTHEELSQGLSFGCLGPCAYSGETQSAIHEWMIDHGFEETVLPQGWDGQIKDQLVFNYAYRYSPWRYQYHDVNFRPYFGTNLGNLYLDGYAGVSIRYSNQPDRHSFFDPLPGMNREVLTQSEHHLYLDALAGPRIFDATLQGNMFQTQKRFSGEINYYHVQIQAGFRYRYKRHVFDYSLTWVAPELKSQQLQLNYHNYGSLSYSCLW